MAFQTARVATGDAQAFDCGRDIPADIDHPAQPQRIQRGGVGLGIGYRPARGGVAAADGQALVQVDLLAQAAPPVDADASMPAACSGL